jgi:TPR repeat protein
MGYVKEKSNKRTENGTGQNLKEALKWYEKAAKQNNLIAIYSIGNIHYYDNGVEVNYRLAFQYYQIAADQGHIDSQVKLGVH